MIPVKGYAATRRSKPSIGTFQIRAPRSRRRTMCSIDILYCGICHSDVHQVRDEWSGASFPMVPGHEIVGLQSLCVSARK